MSRSSTVWVSSRIRSEMVDLPWSMCATIEKLRMWEVSVVFMRDIIAHGQCVLPGSTRIMKAKSRGMRGGNFGRK